MEGKKGERRRLGKGGAFLVKWKPCILLSGSQVGKDALRNPVYTDQEIKRTRARITPWTDEQIEMEGREVTKNEQRFIVPIPYLKFPKCQKVCIDGHKQEITQIIDLSPRFTLVQVKKYKG